MKRRTSVLGLVLVVLLFVELFVATGYLSGAIGMSPGSAMLVITALLVVAVPAVIVVLPDGLFPKRRR